MKIHLYDPQPFGNEYASKLFFPAMRQYAGDHQHTFEPITELDSVRNTTVLLLSDHLSNDRIVQLKNNGCKIVALNITDSSYISGAIRHAPSLQLVDLIFSLTGIQKTNESYDTVVTEDFQIKGVKKQFLEPEDWMVFDYMRRSGRLQSLPYVPWTRITDVERKPYSLRSQKTLIRGGGHARRFLLALFLMRKDLLDPNSGLVLQPYFSDTMNPQFRFCDECRQVFKNNHRYRHADYSCRTEVKWEQDFCNHPARVYEGGKSAWAMSDLGQWNNRCPRSFFWMAEQFQKVHGAVDQSVVEKLINGVWLAPEDHFRMLARITFTSDLKWMHSIYAPQRFWEGAAMGSINILPVRTIEQEYFPVMDAGKHYMVYEEDFKHLDLAFRVDEATYDSITTEARALYDRWIVQSKYLINTNLLHHMFDQIQIMT